MNPLPLSVPVITRDEAANLERCLNSVAGLAAEIVVVDSGSTDGTRAIAERHGARWSHQDWLGYRDQKRVALALCTQPWVLALDADEEVSPAMRVDILAFFKDLREAEKQGGKSDGKHQKSNASALPDGASFPRKVWFLGRWITHGDWYPDRKLRLARRERAQWTGSPEHDRLEVPGPVRKCRGDLHHFSFPDMARYVTKINIFADEYLKRQLADGRRWSLAETLLRPFWRFVRAYFLRRGFLDGFPGLWIAWSTAYQTFVRHSRLYEHTHRGGPPEETGSGKAGSGQAGGKGGEG
ncbi:MAG: glycosyl transferase [Verrucomicrobiales bacterium]|nr:glycosyl transferase [Verrucomicrobiales bacterium]